MNRVSHHSLLCYSPEGFWTMLPPSVSPVSGVSSVTNPAGLLTEDLTDYAVINITGLTGVFDIEVAIVNSSFSPGSSWPLTVALVGVGVDVVAGDFQPDVPVQSSIVATGFLEAGGSQTAHSFGKSYNQRWWGPGGNVTHELRGAGTFNLIYHSFDFGTEMLTLANLRVTLTRPYGANYPIRIGQLFMGRQLVLPVDPRTFVWRSQIINDRYESRSTAVLPAPGTLRRSLSCDVSRIPVGMLHGQANLTDPVAADNEANLHRAIMSNVGAPMLFSPYPYPVFDAKSEPLEADRQMLLRQNFMSIYGQLPPAVEITPGEERDGLNTLFNTRLEFTETL